MFPSFVSFFFLYVLPIYSKPSVSTYPYVFPYPSSIRSFPLPLFLYLLSCLPILSLSLDLLVPVTFPCHIYPLLSSLLLSSHISSISSYRLPFPSTPQSIQPSQPIYQLLLSCFHLPIPPAVLPIPDIFPCPLCLYTFSYPIFPFLSLPLTLIFLFLLQFPLHSLTSPIFPSFSTFHPASLPTSYATSCPSYGLLCHSKPDNIHKTRLDSSRIHSAGAR